MLSTKLKKQKIVVNSAKKNIFNIIYSILILFLIIFSSTYTQCETYHLTVTTVPSQSKVRVLNIEPEYRNGISLTVETADYIELSHPLCDTEIFRIKVSHEDIADNNHITKTLKLNHCKYPITIHTIPEDASVEILHNEMKLPTGNYKVKISKEGYNDVIQDISIENEALKISTIQLTEKQYSLTVETSPSDAVIEFHESSLSYTHGMSISPGTYTINVSKNGFNSKQQIVHISSQNEHLKIMLEQTYPLPRVRVFPENTHLFLTKTNDEIQRKIPYERGNNRLNAGTYRLCGESDGYSNQCINIVIPYPNIDKTIKIALTPNSYSLVVAFQNNSHQNVSKIQLSSLKQGKKHFKYEHEDYQPIRFQTIVNESKTITQTLQESERISIIQDGDKVKSLKIRTDCTNYYLEFIKIERPSPATIDIGIRTKIADDFYKKANEMCKKCPPLLPDIYKSATAKAAIKVVPAFWIQKNTIDDHLFKDLVPQGISGQVSYTDAKKFIEKLNSWAQKRFHFKLPVEKQFVHLARKFYNPLTTNDLRACEDLSRMDTTPINQLFGFKWQLTGSLCMPLEVGNDVADSTSECSDSGNTYIKKGGARSSKNPLECLPEFRAETNKDIGDPDTTFRLVVEF